MGFFRENWLWRGTQSAIFYYLSCSPCIEHKYKKKRRNEAAQAEKHREDVVTTQPGQIRQPGAFQTNEAWVEEILMGPGPPKGWKRDPIAQKAVNADPHIIPCHEAVHLDPLTRYNTDQGNDARTSSEIQTIEVLQVLETGPSHAADLQATSSAATCQQAAPNSTMSILSSSSSASDVEVPLSRPSFDRRLSTAMDTLKVTLRSTIRPERWNWIRYERDDEILSGFNQTVTKMWDKATNFGLYGQSESDSDSDTRPEASRKKKKLLVKETSRVDYQTKYFRNAEINDLHPPVVSRLPATRDEAAWMLLAPPSAAVMGGKVRPQDEPAMRWPLAQIGRTPQEWKDLAITQGGHPPRPPSKTSAVSESIPDLSDSVTESEASETESCRQARGKRHSAPVLDWNPVQEQPLGLVYVKGARRAQSDHIHVDAVG